MTGQPTGPVTAKPVPSAAPTVHTGRAWTRHLRDPAWLLDGLRRYGVAFVLEVLIYYAALQVFQALGYGGKVGNVQVLSRGILLVIVGMAVGEATFRLYRRVWAVAGLQDAIAIGLAVVQSSVLIAIGNALILPPRPYRLLVPILAAPTVAAALGVFRLLPRLLSSVPQASNRLLIVVFDNAGYPTVKALIQHQSPEWSPVGILTTEQADVRKTLMGVPVVGLVGELKHYMETTSADGVAFVVSRQTGVDLHDLFAVCLAAELPIFIVPGPEDWLHDQEGARLRRLTADDLVGRAHRELEIEQAAPLVKGRTVMVTGAAGSIGSELSRMLASLQPARLILLDNNETGLFDIAEELRATTSVEIREALASIVDQDLLLAVLADERPNIVFHAAAYKHVPLLESQPEQALLTNVVGTRNTLRGADAVGVDQFVLVSTDKAVARHSVMGCTKRLCEQLILSYSGPMTCWAVRFGNVVGSRGSVVPIFERQIRQGGPVTITHPDASRYLMTIREAVALVISTLRLAQRGRLYMLDMGEPIKILNLAHALIRSRGLRPNDDIQIVFTGLRPGERLHEALLAPDEGLRTTDHPAIQEVVSRTQADGASLDWTLERLQTLALESKSDELVRALKRAVLPRLPGRPVDEPRIASDASARTARNSSDEA